MNQEAMKTGNQAGQAVYSRKLSELPTRTNLEFKQRNLAQSPPRTQRNSLRYEEPILPTIHVSRLHLRDQPSLGRAAPRTCQAERVHLCAKTRATFVQR